MKLGRYSAVNNRLQGGNQMNFRKDFLGFVLGGLTGAAVALLFAPRSGDETRKLLVDRSQMMKEDALDSIQEAQEVAIDRINEAQVHFDTKTKELLSRLQSIGKNISEEDIDALEASSAGASGN
jgi:gas vesicle protein